MVYINDEISTFDFEAALPLLSAQRRAQALRFTHEEGRKLNAAAYLLLRQGLATEYGIMDAPEFCYTDKGKPFLKDYPDIHFSLSHCRIAAVCALSQVPVGIDVEYIRPLREAVMRYTMNDAEVEQILSSPQPSIEFTRLWTQKEAVLKLRGTGINGTIKDALQGAERLQTIVNIEKGSIYTMAEE